MPIVGGHIDALWVAGGQPERTNMHARAEPTDGVGTASDAALSAIIVIGFEIDAARSATLERNPATVIDADRLLTTFMR
jgi:hypothetical protein